MVQFVSNEDMLTAYLRWKETCPPSRHGAGEWKRFLGFPKGYKAMKPKMINAGICWEVPDMGAERVKIICNSPHWYAMIRAMLAKELAATPE